MLCGSAVDRFLHTSIHNVLNSIIVSNNKRLYYANYSPLIKYVDKDKFNTFITKVNDFLYSTSNKDYSKYNIIKL